MGAQAILAVESRGGYCLPAIGFEGASHEARFCNLAIAVFRRIRYSPDTNPPRWLRGSKHPSGASILRGQVPAAPSGGAGLPIRCRCGGRTKPLRILGPSGESPELGARHTIDGILQMGEEQFSATSMAR